MLFTACGHRDASSHITRVSKVSHNDSTHVDTLIVMDSLFGNGLKVVYNGFGDTDEVQFLKQWKTDSIQHYTYECDHWPDSVMNVAEIANIKHDTKHTQFLTYTEAFVPTFKRYVRDTAAYIKDSTFRAERRAYEKGGAIQ